MQRGNMWDRQIATHRKMEIMQLKMNEMELINVLNDVIYPRRTSRATGSLQRSFFRSERSHDAISRAFVTESPLANKVTSCPARTNSSVRYADDPFRPSVMFRRNALDEWRNLSNSHFPFVPRRFRLRRRTTNSRPTSRGRNGAASPHEFKCCRSQFARDRCFGFVYPLQSNELLNAREQYNLRNRFTSAALGAREIV